MAYTASRRVQHRQVAAPVWRRRRSRLGRHRRLAAHPHRPRPSRRAQRRRGGVCSSATTPGRSAARDPLGASSRGVSPRPLRCRSAASRRPSRPPITVLDYTSSASTLLASPPSYPGGSGSTNHADSSFRAPCRGRSAHHRPTETTRCRSSLRRGLHRRHGSFSLPPSVLAVRWLASCSCRVFAGDLLTSYDLRAALALPLRTSRRLFIVPIARRWHPALLTRWDGSSPSSGVGSDRRARPRMIAHAAWRRDGFIWTASPAVVYILGEKSSRLSRCPHPGRMAASSPRRAAAIQRHRRR